VQYQIDIITNTSCHCNSYYPCVFVLKPRQHLHINKGRIHAFRKASHIPREAHDCHAGVTSRIFEEDMIEQDVLCTSVAWNWMYRGTTCEGITEEVSQSLGAAKLAREHGRQSLAIPQLSLIEMAKFHLARHCYVRKKQSKLLTLL